MLDSAVGLLLGDFDAEAAKLRHKARILFLINEKTNVKIQDTAALEAAIRQIDAVKHVKLFINAETEIPLTTDLANCPGIVSLIANSDIELAMAEKQVRAIFAAVAN